MSERRWGDFTFAAYVDDGGPFGRFVGTASSIEDAERLVVEHKHSDASSVGEHAFVGEWNLIGRATDAQTPVGTPGLDHGPDVTRKAAQP